MLVSHNKLSLEPDSEDHHQVHYIVYCIWRVPPGAVLPPPPQNTSLTAWIIEFVLRDYQRSKFESDHLTYANNRVFRISHDVQGAPTRRLFAPDFRNPATGNRVKGTRTINGRAALFQDGRRNRRPTAEDRAASAGERSERGGGRPRTLRSGINNSWREINF